MISDGIAQTLARMKDAYALLDAAALAANYADECVVQSPVAGLHIGRAAVENAFRTIFRAFPDLTIRVDEFLESGNRAVLVGSTGGTDTGGFMGLPPTGKPFTTPMIFLYTFDDQYKIVREQRVYDFSRLLLHLSGDAEPSTDGPGLYRQLVERAVHEHELKIAADVQRALLPQSRYGTAVCQVAATSLPCRAIGGDFFDYFTMADGGVAVVLGDVAGKGPPAALLAAVLQGIFTANADGDTTPATTITRANKALVRRAVQARFATVVYAVLSAEGRLTYCNAGHNAPFLVGRSGIRRLETGGVVVGAFEHASFEEETVWLEPGDVLVVFSDGVSEARNLVDEEFGEPRVRSCVNANRNLEPSSLVDCFLAAVKEFTAGATQGDDLTVLALRYRGGDSASLPCASSGL